jgi:hypothetical protein
VCITGDCCQERLQGFSVYVGNNAADVLGNAACAVNQDAPLSAPYIGDVTCDASVIVQYLYIRLEGAQRILTVCEVQVQGVDSGITGSYYDPSTLLVSTSNDALSWTAVAHLDLSALRAAWVCAIRLRITSYPHKQIIGALTGENCLPGSAEHASLGRRF